MCDPSYHAYNCSVFTVDKMHTLHSVGTHVCCGPNGAVQHHAYMHGTVRCVNERSVREESKVKAINEENE